MCQTLLSSRACYLHRNVERRRDDPAFVEAGVMDIEDLIKVSNATKVCPYYMSRELKQSADIVFMPYNYLLDPRTRRQQDVDMNVCTYFLSFCNLIPFLNVFYCLYLSFTE